MNKVINIKTENLPFKDIEELSGLQSEGFKVMDKNRLNRLQQNLIENGFISPLFIWGEYIIDGNQRLFALKSLIQQGYRLFYKDKDMGNKVPYISIQAKDRQEAAKFVLAYNSQFGEIVGLKEFLNEFKLDWSQIDGQIMLPVEYQSKFGKPNNSLRKNWVVPPFSVLDSRMAYWQERKREWANLFGNTVFTREEALGGDLLASINSGVSIFDPVLAELIFKWFCPKKGGKILNLFAGDPEPNLVAAYNGYNMVGIELRQEQVDHINRIANRLGIQNNLNMICDDVLNLEKHTKDNEFDEIFSCAPYYDLEEYSDDERDFANKEEADFDMLLEQVINAGAKKLKDNRFAVFVVSEVRRPDGSYRGFVPKVIRWFEQAGLTYYNEIILVNSIGTLPFRINKAWQNRKVGKMHQNVLVFFKGKIKEVEKDFDKLRQVGSLHQKVLVFFKGEMGNIKKEFERQEALLSGETDIAEDKK